MKIPLSRCAYFVRCRIPYFRVQYFLSVHTLRGLAMPPIVNAFMAVMVPTGWMKVVGACQVLGGGLVLFDGTAPLGLIVLCPITVNILLFHICLLGGQGILPGLLTAILEMILISHYRANFAPIMGVKAY